MLRGRGLHFDFICSIESEHTVKQVGDLAESVVASPQGWAVTVQGEPICVGRDIVAGPVVTQVVLSFPGWIHDQVIGPGNDLEAHQTRREPWLKHLIALSGLGRVVYRIGQKPSEWPDELFDAMAITF